MSDPTDTPEYHAAPVSSLRSKFEQLAAQSSTSAAPSHPSSTRGRPLGQYGGSAASSSSQSLAVSEFGEGIPRVRARSNPSAPPPIPGPKPHFENGDAFGNEAANGGVIAPMPRKSSEVRASPSSPDLGMSYRREGYLEAGGYGASSEGSTPPDTRPPRPISRREGRTPTASPGPTSRPHTPAPSPPRARTPAPAPPPPRARTPAPPTPSIAQPIPSAPPASASASTSTVPTVVIDPAALARKPPPPPPSRPRTSGDGAAQVQFQVHTPNTPSKYIGLPPRSPSDRSLSPVTRSSSAPSFSVSRPVPIPNGSVENEGSVLEDGQYTESPPPLPARPGGPPTIDELARRPVPSPSSSSATLPLRHRPTVSTSAVPTRGTPPSVPRRPATGTKVSPVAREVNLSPEAPPLPSRPRISPVSSDDATATLITVSGSSSSASHSPSVTATPAQGTAPPLPVRKIVAPLPLSSVALAPELSSPFNKAPWSAPPTHPAIEKRQGSLDSTTSPPPPPNPMPAYPVPPSRSLDSQPASIPSSPLPPHLPPPTRNVTISARPAKREKSGDDESESDEEYDNDSLSLPGASMLPVPSPTPGNGLRKGAEDLPDATNSNRRPPHMFLDKRSFPAATHLNQYPVVAVAGSFVVVAGWTVRVYDVENSTTEAVLALNLSLDDTGLEWRVKEPRVTAMEFRPGTIREEDGRYLWLGTKDGHLWELDVWTGIITETRPQAHSSAVTHIFRHRQSMITIEESGKMLVFDSDEANGVNAPQMSLSPRFIRIGEKQLFAKVLGKQGQVWVSEGSAGGGTVGGAKSLSNTPTKGPAIRVYDIRSRENGGTAAYRTIVCPEALGAVTAGCILPTQPDIIYLGHEGGSLTLWSRNDEDPKFIKSVKIGPSDILALDGVMNRLWIGSRQGVIAAYDVSPWPWRVTNMWKAHGDSPITKLLVDVIGIERNHRLTVLSVGKDEKVRLWDGLLMYHWINDELLKREEEFATFRPINVLLCTWNVDAAKPEMLTGTAENATFFEQVLHSIDAPDIIVFSFQELIDLENRKLTAKTVLLGGGKRADGGLSDKVSRHYRLWYDKLVSAVRIAMPPEEPYTPILTENLVGLFSCVFVRASEKRDFKDVHITTVKRGMGGIYGNKGAIVARFAIDDTSLCFINCHLAAGQRHVRERNTDVAAVLEDKSLLPESEIEDDDNLAYGGGGDGTMALDHEICFLNGDLNYRIDQRRDAVIANVKTDNFIDLLPYDQLQKELKNNPGFRLRGFSEAPITFKPTYKYDKRSDDYDSSGKQRTPAWCDRILFRCRDPKRITPLAYKRMEPNISDHRPVVGVFRVTVKSLSHELRYKVKQQLLEEWRGEESRNLGLALTAYQQQGLLVHSQQQQ